MISAMFPNGVSHYAIGGILMGVGVALLYATTGRPGGVSTFFSAAWSWFVRTPFFRQASFLDTRHWRLVYALGLLLGGLLYSLFSLPVAHRVTVFVAWLRCRLVRWSWFVLFWPWRLPRIRLSDCWGCENG